MKQSQTASLATIVTLAATAAFGSPLMPGQTVEHRRASNGSVIKAPLTDWIKNTKTDLQWYTTISVGTPPQNFTVIIDTGSTGLLIPQSNCTACGSGHSLFDPSLSSTFSWSPDAFTQPYFSTGGDTIPFSESESEGANCTAVTDDVSMEGLTATAFQFLICGAEGEALASMPDIDGILGFGIHDPSGFEYSLYSDALLASPVFGMYTPAGQVTGGELTVGGVDESKIDGELQWLALDPTLSKSHGTWVIDMQALYINGQQLMVARNDTTRDIKVPYPESLTILDTGTSFLMAPDFDTARDIYAQISDKIFQVDSVGTWGAPCEDMDAITAELTFTFGSDGATQLNVTMPSSVFNLGPYPGLDSICQAVINNYEVPVHNDDGRGVWVTGSPLLKGYYTAWNGMDLKVGLANLSSSPTPMAPGSATPSEGQSLPTTHHSC